MSRVEGALREPWESLLDQREAATFGMWVFLVSEVLFFGALVAGYTYVRVLHPADVAAAARLTNLSSGAINTAILLTSGFCMATALKAADLELRRMSAVCLAATAALGLAFLILKGFEYREDLRQHLLPGPDFALPPPAAQLFFSFYWAITGVHAVHLAIGVLLAGRLAVLVLRRRLPTRSPQVEVTALYWGFVDVVWVVVFPLLYLVGRR